MQLALFISLLFGAAPYCVSQVDADDKSAKQPPDSQQKMERVDPFGDSLPEGAIARIGTDRWRIDGVTPLIFSSDGKRLVGTNPLMLIDPETGIILRRFDISSWNGFLMDDDKTLMLASGGKSRLLFLNIESGSINREIKIADFDGISDPVWSSDGRILAFRNYHAFRGDGIVIPPPSVAVWDTVAGRKIQHWENARWSYRLWPGGKTLTISDKGELIDVDIASGKELRRVPNWLTTVSVVKKAKIENRRPHCFSPDGKIVAIAENGTITLWDAAQAKPLVDGNLSPSKLDGIYDPAMVFSKDGRYLAVGGRGGQLYVFDIVARKLIFHAPHAGGGEGLLGMVFSHDGRKLITRASQTASARLWEVPSGKALSPVNPVSRKIEGLSFAFDGKTIATVGPVGTMSLWDTSNGRLVQRFEKRPNQPFFEAMDREPDGKRLAATFGDYLGVWHAKDGSPVPSNVATRDGIHAKIWLDQRTLLVAFDGDVFFDSKPPPRSFLEIELPWTTFGYFDVQSNKATPLFHADVCGIENLVLSSDRRTVVTTGYLRRSPMERYLFVWDLLDKGEQFRIPLQDEEERTSVASFSSDGRAIITKTYVTDNEGRGDIVLKFIEIASGKNRLTAKLRLNDDGPTLLELRNEHLGVINRPECVHVIDPVNGEVFQVINIGSKEIGLESISHDGRFLATSNGNAALIWNINPVVPARKHVNLSKENLIRHWDNLQSNDAVAAFQSILRLSEASGQTINLLKAKLKPAAPVAADRIKGYIRNLDSPVFAEREKATQELLRLGEAARAELAEFLKAPPSFESKRRAESIHEKLWAGGRKGPYPAFTGELLQDVRAVEILEMIGGSEPLAILEALAKGTPYAVLTREAVASVARMKK